MIKQVIWSSTIDWPNKNCTVLFFGSCNFKCPYCYNTGLFNLPEISFNDIIERLKGRKTFIDHVILSGGECTIAKDFLYVVDTLYDEGFKIGIHTNGSNFDVFEKVKDKISFIGLDIKSSIDRYKEFCNFDNSVYMSLNRYLTGIRDNDYEYEIRTTLDSGMTLEELKNVAYWLKNIGIKKWILQLEMKEGERQMYFGKFGYASIQKNLNEIMPVRFKEIL